MALDEDVIRRTFRAINNTFSAMTFEIFSNVVAEPIRFQVDAGREVQEVEFESMISKEVQFVIREQQSLII